ncbi:MAG: hypothetical protein QOJ59_5157 [Thermomicrobiales bacterium]|nr:hypothetical protein [Thermomicrobiales bacterium]
MPSRLPGLGLTSTYLETLEPVPSTAGPRAHQYDTDIDTYAFDSSFDHYGSSGLISSVEDLGRFYRALLRGEIFHHPKTLATMLTIPNAGSGSSAAMGLFRYEIAGSVWWRHSGFWGTTAIYSPDLDLTLTYSATQDEVVSDLDAESLIGGLLTVVGDAAGTPTA